MRAYKVGCSVMNLTILIIFQVILYAKNISWFQLHKCDDFQLFPFNWEK